MKAYALYDDERNNIGCCPGHDWPRLYSKAGRYRSAGSRRCDSKSNRLAKRIRRHRDKQLLMEIIDEVCG